MSCSKHVIIFISADDSGQLVHYLLVVEVITHSITMFPDDYFHIAGIISIFQDIFFCFLTLLGQRHCRICVFTEHKLDHNSLKVVLL